jgi:hypothetical protein
MLTPKDEEIASAILVMTTERWATIITANVCLLAKQRARNRAEKFQLYNEYVLVLEKVARDAWRADPQLNSLLN